MKDSGMTQEEMAAHQEHLFEIARLKLSMLSNIEPVTNENQMLEKNCDV